MQCPAWMCLCGLNWWAGLTRAVSVSHVLCSADIDRALLPTRNTAVATTIVLQPLDNPCQLPDPSVRTDGFHSSEVLLPSSFTAKPSRNLLQRTGGDHRGDRAQPGWRTFMMTCLRWILGYMRLEIIGLSADWCLCAAPRTHSAACCYWKFGWRRGVVVSGVRQWTKLTHVRPGYNWDGWPSSGGYTISGCNQPTRSTQPCIPPGSLNRVPALAGVKAGMSPLLGGR